MEGTRSYGAGLARYLAAGGEQVAEIDGSRYLGRRRAGKSDEIDAVRAACELLAGPHAGAGARGRGPGGAAAAADRPRPRGRCG